MHRRAIINSKIIPVNENCKRAFNPMPSPLYGYLSGSVFSVNFANSNKQLSNLKPVFKSPNHLFSV